MEVSSELMDLVWPIILILLGWGNSYLFEGLQSVVAQLQKLPAPLKQVAFILIQFALVKASVFLGLPLPDSLEGITPEILMSITSGLVGMGIHVKGKEAVKRPES